MKASAITDYTTSNIIKKILKLLRLLIFCLFIILSASECPATSSRGETWARLERVAEIEPSSEKAHAMWDNDFPTHTLLTFQSNNNDRWIL